MEKLNTIPVQQFIQQVKSADASKQKEIRMDINTAKNLAFTLGIVMSRLEGDLEELISSQSAAEDTIEIKIDQGSSW